MTRVEIEYCAPCGDLDQARDLATHLLDSLGELADGVNVTNVQEHVFRVRVGEAIVSEGADVSPDDVEEAVRDALASGGGR